MPFKTANNNNSKAKGKGVTKIPMGDVAVAMLNCIECMHNNGNLFNDVKPENFMLAEPSTSKKSNKASSSSSSAIKNGFLIHPISINYPELCRSTF